MKKAGYILPALILAALIASLASCDCRLMSNREVEQCLQRTYGREFTVTSSRNISSDDYSREVWRAKLYLVSPKEEPDTSFFVFNTVTSESFGVPGFSNGLQDTYSLDIFRTAFEEVAAKAGISYTLSYIHPIQSSRTYYSDLYIQIDPVCSENLTAVCTALSQAFTATLKQVPQISGVAIFVTYQEPSWPEEKSYRMRLPADIWNKAGDGSAETKRIAKAMQDYILSKVEQAEAKP